MPNADRSFPTPSRREFLQRSGMGLGALGLAGLLGDSATGTTFVSASVDIPARPITLCNTFPAKRSGSFTSS